MEKFTSPYKPWVLIASIMVHTRKDALNLEKKIKGFKKRARQLEYFKKVSPGSEK